MNTQPTLRVCTHADTLRLGAPEGRTAPRLCALVAAISWVIAPAVVAAPMPQDDRHAPTKMDAIEVTASPLRSSVEELSDPVSVLAGEELDERKSSTLGETVSGLPGVQSSNFGSGVGRPIIRGLEGARVAILAGGLSTQDVSTMSQDHASTVEPFLADQIEVLKGPATLLYGSGAIGGAVNIVDGRIAETTLDAPFSGRAEVRHDSVSDGRTGMFRIDAGSERLALHADAVSRRNDDYQVPGDGRQANSFLATDAGSIGGSWLGDWGFFGLALSRYQDRYGNPGEPGDAASGEPGVFLEIQQNRMEGKGAIEDPFAGARKLRLSFAGTTYEHLEFQGEEVGTRFTKDAREGRIELTHDTLAHWNGAIGVQAVNSEFAAIGEEAFVPRTRTRAYGLFLVEQRQWEGLQLDLGARVDSVRSDPAQAAGRSFNPLSLSAGAIVEIDEHWDLVVNLDHAERAPVEEELFANGPHVATAAFEIGDARLREEVANQVELGWHFHGAGLEAKAAAYYNRFDDFIYLRDTGQSVGEGEAALPVRQWSQLDARFRGLEGEATFELADNATGNWKVRVFGDAVRATLKGAGNVPRLAPGRFGSELRWASEAWRASLSIFRNAKQDKVAESETPTKGYTLINVSAAYHFDVGDYGWELFLEGRNLSDQQARVHTSFLKDRVVLPGRAISLGVRVFF